MGSRQELLKTYLHVQSLNVIGRFRHDSLTDNYGSLNEALKAPEKDLRNLPGINQKIAHALKKPKDENALEKEIENLDKRKINVTLIVDADYPQNLKSCDDSPIILHSYGNILDPDQMAFAIVGSRNCSEYGRSQAYQFGYELSSQGFTVVSGMARGIDSAAHRGALAAGGRTIAVQACGLNHIYPASAKKLSEDIKSHGAVLTEMSWGTPPLPYYFPRRNRIISGLSLGTLVIEAHEKSGSLITARWAMEQNRDVFALPGRIDSQSSKGCHRLIQDGAKLITHVDEITEEFPSLTSNKTRSKKIPKLTEDQKKVLTLLHKGNNDFNKLITHSEMSPGNLSLVLFKLEGLQLIKAHAGKRWMINDRCVPALLFDE